MTYLNVTIETMAKRTSWYIRAILKCFEMRTHVLMTPGFVSGKLRDVIPLVIGSPSEVHGVDLRATTQGGTTRVVDACPTTMIWVSLYRHLETH